MDFVNRYPCPTCRTSFRPESHLPLRLFCPSCQTRWFCSLRERWLAGGYAVAYGIGMAVSFVWPTRTAALPVLIFLMLFLAAFWKSLALVSVDEMLAERAKLSRNPVSLIAVAMLLLAAGGAFAAAVYPRFLTPLAVVVVGMLPPAFVMLAYRFSAFFRSRLPAYVLIAVGTFLGFFAGVLPTGGPFVAMLMHFVGMFLALGALVGAAAPRTVPAAPQLTPAQDTRR